MTLRDHEFPQEDLKELEDWAATWNIRFQSEKSTILQKQKHIRPQ